MSEKTVRDAASVARHEGVSVVSQEVESEQKAAVDPEFARAENEDDDGYDPWSDRRPVAEALFERDPWS